MASKAYIFSPVVGRLSLVVHKELFQGEVCDCDQAALSRIFGILILDEYRGDNHCTQSGDNEVTEAAWSEILDKNCSLANLQMVSRYEKYDCSCDQHHMAQHDNKYPEMTK